ncbi:MAG: ribosome maturation factor RimM [Pseudomonadota bacterium]
MKLEREPVVLGSISGVYGVKGWVRVHSFTHPRTGLLDYRDCLIKCQDTWQPTHIADGKRHGKGLVVRLNGVDDRDAACTLVGSDLGVYRASLPEPDQGHYYWADLEGLEVRRVDGAALGRVSHLLETGANDVLVVRGNREILIPFLTESVVRDVDLEAGLIVVDWEWE